METIIGRIGAAVVLAIGLVIAFAGNSNDGVGVPGVNLYPTTSFTESGGVTTVTPTSGSYTLTASDMAISNFITFTASTTMPALTLTLPATSSFPLSTDVGATRTWIVENPFTAAATTTTIAAGTGVDLQEPDGQNVVIGINNYAYVTATRLPDSDIAVRVDETIPAD